MSDEKNLEEIFAKTIEIESPEKRRGFLDGACQGDEELRAKINGLIKAYEAAGHFMEKPWGDVGDAGEFTQSADLESDPDETRDARVFEQHSQHSPGPSSTIGPYKLLQVIGEGGMGTVWMAEQEQPVRRRVALKLIRPEMGSKEIIARFEAERQALAIMDHPNIARVLDGGTTEAGIPYFVMELVNGIPLNKFCDRNELSIRERMKLFVPICNAVQHAHQKGIIHRDLKPSNVLVTLQDGKPLPKVIDFGLAKALEHAHKLTDKTLFTEFGKVVGTVQYMSPEQAEMSALEVDTRTDIFSLGIMLYELLTGSTPIEKDSINNVAVWKLLAMIRDTDPPLPSARLSSSGEKASSICQQRKIAPAKLQQILKGELDWVVMKAIEKDRSRRYETASAFADDIKRYLDDEAVVARPPSLVYKVSKFVRKNRGWVAAASIILFLLVAGIAGTSIGLYLMNEARIVANEKNIEATEQKNRADFERDRAIGETKKVEKYALEVNEQRKEIRRNLYVADMNRVEQIWATGLVSEVDRLLQRHVPVDQEEDNRSFEWYFFKRLCDRLKNVPKINYGEIVTIVRPIPKSNEIAAFGNDGTIQIWKRGAKEAKQVITHELGRVSDLVLSADGRLLAALSRRGFSVWRNEGKQFAFLFKDQIRRFSQIQFAHRPSTLVTQVGTNQIKVWDLNSAEPQEKILSTSKGIQAFCAIAPDSIAVSYRGGGLQLFDLATLRSTNEEFPTKGNVTQIIQPGSDKLRIYAVKSDGIELLKLDDNQLVRDSEIDLKDNSPEYTLVSDNGEIIVIGRSKVEMFAGDGQRFGEVTDMQNLNQKVQFDSKNGLLVGAGREKNSIHLWNKYGEKQGELRVHSNHVYTLAVGADGEIISGSRDMTIKFSKSDLANDHDLMGRHMLSERKPGWIWSLAFSQDDRYLASCAEDQIVKVWDLVKGELAFEITDHQESVQFVAFSPDKRFLASGSRDHTVRLTDLETQQVVVTLSEHEGAVNSLSYSSDGKKLASVADDGKLIVWNLESNQPDLIHELEEEDSGKLWAVQFDEQDQGIFFGGTNNRLEYLSLKPEPKVTWSHDTKANLTSLAISPDGKKLSATSSNGVVSLFDLASKELVVEFKEHSSDVLSNAFAPDLKTLASGCRDGRIRFWNLATFDRTVSLPAHDTHIHCVRFSNNGKILASSSFDGTIRLWRRD